MSTNPFGKQGWTPERIESLEGKTFFFTKHLQADPFASGAGYQASKILLSKGAEVVMLNRNESKSNEAIEQLRSEAGSAVKVSFIKMDLASLDSVRKAAKDFIEKVPHIDALMCNAAVAQIGKQEFTTDGFESQIGINHYGHFLLIHQLFDRIDSSKGRIVVVGSEGYKMGLKTIQFDDMNLRWQLPSKSYLLS